MTLHCDYLRTLERVSQIDKPVMSTQLMGQTGQFLQRRWILEDGYLSVIPVDVLDGEDEADVEVDVDAGTYSFHRLGGQTAKVTRPIAEITVYSFNVDAWLNEITTLFDIEPSKVSRKRELIQGHLWHLGDLRVNRSSRFVPLYVSRRPKMCLSEWEQNLRDHERSSHGIVLVTDSETGVNLPNHHQVRELDALLTDVTNVLTLKGDVLHRMLGVDVVADVFFVGQLHARKLTTSACGTSAGAQVNEIKFPRLVLILIMWRAIEMPYQAPAIWPRTAKHGLT